MSLHEYRQSIQLETQEMPFYSLIMAAMRKADNSNESKLRAAWPDVWDELEQRYHAPGGLIGKEVEECSEEPTLGGQG